MNPRSAVLVCALTLAACARPPAGPVALAGASAKFDVKGQYFPITIGQVDSVKIEDGKIAIHGGDATVTEELPAGADATKPNLHWALTTENDQGNLRRLVFTHDELVEDFTIDLPASEAMPHYGVLSGPNGTDVMILAWGERSRSYWAYVTITKK